MRGAEAQEKSLTQKIKSPVLVSQRLVLRLPHIEDIDELVKLADNKRISAMFDKMPYPFTRAAAEEFVRRAAAGQIGYYVYAITRADTGAFIGCCGIGAYKGGSWTKPGGQSAVSQGLAYAPGAETAAKDLAETEVFFWLGEPFWGQGYGEEVTIALIDVAFRATEISALYARALVSNMAARKILQKCGFSLLGPSGHIAKGAAQAEAMAHYHLTRETWLALRSRSTEPKAKNGSAATGNASA